MSLFIVGGGVVVVVPFMYLIGARALNSFDDEMICAFILLNRQIVFVNLLRNKFLITLSTPFLMESNTTRLWEKEPVLPPSFPGRQTKVFHEAIFTVVDRTRGGRHSKRTLYSWAAAVAVV